MTNTIKPVLKATCIKQSPAFEGQFFLASEKENKFKFPCIKQPSFFSNQFLDFC